MLILDWQVRRLGLVLFSPFQVLPMWLRPVFVLFLLIGAPSVGRAQSSATKPVADSLVAVVERFFRAMAQRDTATLRSLTEPEGHAFALLWRQDSVEVSVATHREMLAPIAKARERWRERMWNPTVLHHGPLAVVWAPYDFHLDRKFSHCGVDTFTLIRRTEGWRIADVAFTMEPEGCKPSPLGPLR
jgi:hypothetical protein